MKYDKTKAFTLENRKNLILDFYNFYYYFQITLKDHGLGDIFEEKTSKWKESIIECIYLLELSCVGKLVKEDASKMKTFTITNHETISGFMDENELSGDMYDKYFLTVRNGLSEAIEIMIKDHGDEK